MGIRYHPEKFFSELVLRVLDTVISFFSFTYMLKVIVDGLMEQRPISELIVYVSVMLGLYLVISVLRDVYWGCIHTVLDKVGGAADELHNIPPRADIGYRKLRGSSMYALFGRAVSGGVGSIEWARYWFIGTVCMIVNLGLSSWLALTIDPVLFIFAFVPVVFNFLRKKMGALERVFRR